MVLLRKTAICFVVIVFLLSLSRVCVCVVVSLLSYVSSFGILVMVKTIMIRMDLKLYSALFREFGVG